MQILRTEIDCFGEFRYGKDAKAVTYSQLSGSILLKNLGNLMNIVNTEMGKATPESGDTMKLIIF